MKEYVELRNGGYYVKGKRLMLDTIVALFQEGASPESMHRLYPFVSLEEFYGAITFYLSHQELVDTTIAQAEEEFHRAVPPLSEQAPELYAKLMRAKEQLGAKQT